MLLLEVLAKDQLLVAPQHLQAQLELGLVLQLLIVLLDLCADPLGEQQPEGRHLLEVGVGLDVAVVEEDEQHISEVIDVVGVRAREGLDSESNVLAEGHDDLLDEIVTIAKLVLLDDDA